MQTFYKKLNLTAKLSFIVILAVIISVAVVGFYFDAFLKEKHLQQTKKQMEYGFHRLASELTNSENELKKGIAFIQHDESLLASIDLINNYQDKENYNAVLLDEEKKNIAEQLLDRVKLSLNNDIALYDKDEELIAFVTKEAKGYCLNFISYKSGEKVLYSRYESEKVYTEKPFEEYKLMRFKHIDYYDKGQVLAKSTLTYHLFDDEIFIKSHRSISEPGEEKVLAHIEMSYMLGKTYLQSLSNDLDITIASSRDEKYASLSHPLLGKNTLERMKIVQTDEEYFSAAILPTQNGNVYLVATLNKTLLITALDENREKLLLLLLLVTAFILLSLRSLFKRGLANPLEKLMAQINKIERGDYSRSKPIRTGDELEAISKNVNQLALTICERESALQKSQENLEYLSHHDTLTDLPNRRLFTLRLQHAIDLAARNKTKVAILFLDLDHFKEVNDTLGHDIGDELLRAVSKRLNSMVRTTDTLARIGGDEFNIMIENIETVSEIEVIIKKLLDSFKAPFICSDHEINTTTSIGVSLYPNDGLDSVALIKNADLAMYKSKDVGRNSYSFFSKELSDYLEERTARTNALKFAVEAGKEFFLLYQPKISLQTGKIAAIEALVRWDSLELGFVRPDQFIGLAEETRLIIPLGEWILRQACSDFVKLQADGYALDKVSINISAVQLQNSDMIQTLQKSITMTGILPSQIELEITESYIATNVQNALQTLQGIREMGVDLAIDDFGTGYSSMSYLQKLPVTRLKIDKSFVDDLPASQESVAVAKAIIALAKTFKLSITAEGVETKEQVDFLQREECDEIQGYFYAKPFSVEELKAYYKETEQR